MCKEEGVYAVVNRSSVRMLLVSVPPVVEGPVIKATYPSTVGDPFARRQAILVLLNTNVSVQKAESILRIKI